MARKGRELEELIANFERLLGPKGISVTSPDFIPDKDTGELREVDISLRSQIGSAELLVIVECRDYSHKTQDVKWIEELAAKRESVGADRVLAVSSTGFTDPATRKAEMKNITLRRMSELDYQEISHWFSFKEINFIRHKFNIDRTELKTPDITMSNEFRIKDMTQYTKIFKNKDGKKLSIRDLLYIKLSGVEAKHVWDSVPQDGTKVKRIILLDFKGKDNIKIETNSGDIGILQAKNYVTLWAEHHKIPVSPIKSYLDEKGNLLACEGRFELESPDGTLTFDIKRAGSQVFLGAKVETDTNNQSKP